ncbi:MAG TPA: ThuA domain-containing protein [Pirellulales bacterium]|nr:ThuA domain-containing protein [Pirellulales bacterium]
MKAGSTWLVMLVVALGAHLSLVVADERTDGTSVLFIGKQPDHPYGSHMYLHAGRMLSECLRINGVKAVVSDGWPKEVPEGLKTIVVYTSPGAELLLDSPHRDEFVRLMQRGVGLVTIHWASSVQQDHFDRLGERWMSCLGGTWISNVGLSTDTSELKQLLPDHPICRGWTNYELHDEYYLNPTISKDAQPLLQVTTKGQDVIVGWAYERPDGGRAYGTTLGHFYSNFEREPFRRALVNAILWTGHREIPKTGARVDIGDDFLKLPPERPQ